MKTKLLLLSLFTIHYSIFTAFAQWSAPVNLSPTTTAVGLNENAGQCIAVVGDTVRVTYSDRSTAMAKIMYNQSHDKGLTWGTPVQLFSSLNCGFTAIASSGSSVHIVWMDSLGATRASYYKRSLDGGATWGPRVCLDSFTKFWPGIACNGNLVVATLNKDLAGNTEVFVKRSLTNGTTWLPEQQVSNAPNRSEDPAICILGNDVHLSWNDKRSGVMNIYYCHSADGGATWGPETGLTTVDSYTSMVCANGNYVDVPLGERVGNFFDCWLAESNNVGSSFIPNQNLTNTAATSELYPFMTRDAMQLHIVHIGPGGVNYRHSTDGGVTWDSTVVLGGSGQSFIAYTGCVLHLIFSNAGHLYYMRNPTGNGICSTVGITNSQILDSKLKVYPNPFAEQTTFEFSSSLINDNAVLRIYDVVGQKVISKTIVSDKLVVGKSELTSGIYFYQLEEKGKSIATGKLVVE